MFIKKFNLKINNKSVKQSFIVCLGFSIAGLTRSATLTVGGDYRFGSNLYSNLDAGPGVRAGGGNTSTFWETRLLVRPDILIDDRFSFKNEFNLLQLKPRTQSSGAIQNDVPPDFGAPLDRTLGFESDSMGPVVRKAYLEWASDWGLMRVGRQPKNWGLGILYNSGSDPLNDYSTHVDRVGFQALLGNLGLHLGYEKSAENSLNLDDDDAEVFEIALDYSNPEALFDVGMLYSRGKRLPLAGLGLVSSHDFSIFSSRRWGSFQLGAEAASIDQEGAGSKLGVLTQIDWIPEAWNLGFDFAYASANSTGNFAFHPNYQPFMILFRQGLGPSRNTNQVRGGVSGANQVGGAVGEGSGAGALVAKARLLFNFDQEKYKLGTDFGFAKLVNQGSNAGTSLGFETDIHLAHKWYKNFTMNYGLGLLFPSSALGQNTQTVWGFQLRGVLLF